MYEPHDLTPPSDEFASRLRAARPATPKIDRDRLMYLAGQRSVKPARKALWPALTVASWAACAVLVGLAFNRPPQVVTKTKIVERVVERPVITEPAEPQSVAEDATVAASRNSAAATRSASVAPPLDFAFLDDLQQPLTALASRPALFELVTQPAAIATDAPPAIPPNDTVKPKRPQTYGELRRELLGEKHEPAPPTVPLRWF